VCSTCRSDVHTAGNGLHRRHRRDSDVTRGRATCMHQDANGCRRYAKSLRARNPRSLTGPSRRVADRSAARDTGR